MIKYDKHPNGKLRRNYKDMVSVECTVECIAKEAEKHVELTVNDGKSSSRAASKNSATRAMKPSNTLTTARDKKRLESPNPVNINVEVSMGEMFEETIKPVTPGAVINSEPMIASDDNRIVNRGVTTLGVIQQTANAFDVVRVNSNSDLDMIDK